MNIRESLIITLITTILLASFVQAKGQSYLIGAPSPSIGSAATFTALIQYMQFDVLSPTGVIIDSVDLYPTGSVGSPFTIVVQNSSSTVIASWSGTIAVTGGTTPQRIKLNLLIPPGTGYKWGFSVNPGMTRNSTGGVYPYVVPNVMSITGNTFNPVYYYFFYNIRIMLPAIQTDAGISAIASPGDSVCAGSQPVQVIMKNYGPNALTSGAIHWSVNNIPQTPFPWTGTVPVNGTTNITVGNYTFATGTSYDIKAYTHLPNNQADTVNTNDTLIKPGIYVKSAPTATFNASANNLCLGDTLMLSGTLTGTPPWTLVMSNGTIQQTVANIYSSVYMAPLVPPATTTYTLVSVEDASGCITLEGTTQTVTVNPAPPATITPQGSPTACAGDSVALMGSVGLGFGYQWYKDGVLWPCGGTFVCFAKQSGNYTLEVTSPIGCKNLSDPLAVTIHPLPVVNLGNDTVLLPTQVVQLNAGAGFSSYLWSTGATTQQATIDNSGTGIGVKTVWVVVTDNNGCQGSDTLMINFTNNPGMEEITKGTIRIHPNPTTGQIVLNLPFSGENLIEVFSLDGRKVHTEVVNIKASEPMHSTNLKHLPDGSYLLSVINGQFRYQTKVIIVK
jgi:hypothetical protein